MHCDCVHSVCNIDVEILAVIYHCCTLFYVMGVVIVLCWGT